MIWGTPQITCQEPDASSEPSLETSHQDGYPSEFRASAWPPHLSHSSVFVTSLNSHPLFPQPSPSCRPLSEVLRASYLCFSRGLTPPDHATFLCWGSEVRCSGPKESEVPVSAGPGSAHASLVKRGKQEVECGGVHRQGGWMNPTWIRYENSPWSWLRAAQLSAEV